MLNQKESWQLLESVVQLLKQHISDARNKKIPVLSFKEPESLQKNFDLWIATEGTSLEWLLETIQWVIENSVATQHPRFFNQLYAWADPVWIVWELLTAVLNTSMASYEISPLFTLMEAKIYAMMAEILWRSDYDWMMLAWWSAVNMHAMHVARFRLDYWYHDRGLYDSPRLWVFTSDQAHYSISKAALLMWLWKKSVYKVKTDTQWRMLVSDLEEKIQNAKADGVIPFFINATSGTTVLGAYDPLDEIVAIGEKNNMRVHVDAIWWWWVLFVDELRHKMPALDKVDSLWWNPHKMMWVPQQSSLFMTRHPDRNGKCNVLKAKYLFQEDKWYNIICDTWDKYTQCGRKPDILKLRLQWKSYGHSGLSMRVQSLFDHADYLKNKINESERLILLQEPECTNVCFRYIPKDMDKEAVTHNTIRDDFDRIHALTSSIKDEMLKRWEMMVTYCPVKDLPNFFRMVFVRHDIKKEDIDFVVDHIVSLGNELSDA